MTVMRGPTNPTLNDEAGLLVDGFDSPPVLMMTYNPKSYIGLIEGQGFRKAKDLLAYWFPLEEKPLARLSRVADRFRKRASDIVVRNVTKGGLERDLVKIREVYNAGLGEELGLRADDAGGDGLHGQAHEAAPRRGAALDRRGAASPTARSSRLRSCSCCRTTTSR